MNNVFINKKQQAFIFFIALIFCFIPVLITEASVLSYTKGVFIYPVDDTFIHMELAKNLAEHGNWGINSHEFASASSSIFYTLILALLFKLFSAHIIFPFLINIIAGIFILIVVSNWLAKQQLNAVSQLIIMLLVIFFTPLPAMIMSGMEHTLQCLFSFLFIFHASDWIAENAGNENKWKLPWKLVLYAGLVTFIRYESLFLIAAVCLLLLFYKKIRIAFQLGFAGLLPVLVFGLFSLSKGSYFLPNSVLIKSAEVPLFGGGIAHFFEALFVEKLTYAKAGITAIATERLLLLLPFCYFFFLTYLKIKSSYTQILLLLTAVILMHLAFASTGKFYRYEAYLFLSTSVIVFTILFKYGKDILKTRPKPVFLFFTGIAFFFLIFPSVLRSAAAYTKTKQACINIYEQQYQMGGFLKTYYANEGIAANDIGAVSYFTNGYVVDLWGLGNTEIAKSRKNNHWNPRFLDSISRNKNAKLAIVYDSWFQDSLKNHWQKIATWQIQNNVVCGDDIVSFYAIDTTIASQLKSNLEAYQKLLPPNVSVKYY